MLDRVASLLRLQGLRVHRQGMLQPGAAGRGRVRPHSSSGHHT